MEQRLLDLACRVCEQRPGDYLFDCQCLLCADCFGQIAFADYTAPPAPPPRLCRVCRAETQGENVELTALTEREKLLTLCNCYVVSCYLQLKTAVLRQVAEVQAQQQRTVAEVNKSLACAREREEILSRFFAWCVARHRIRLEDVEPRLLLRDKEKVLMKAFGNEEVQTKSPLNDTKKKDKLRNFALNDVNPFSQNIFQKNTRGKSLLALSPPGRPFALGRAAAASIAEDADRLIERDSEDFPEHSGKVSSPQSLFFKSARVNQLAFGRGPHDPKP